MGPSFRLGKIVQQTGFMISVIFAGGLGVTLPLPAQIMENGSTTFPALGSEAAPVPNRPEQVDLAVEHLLLLNTLMTDRIDDPVWDLQAETGKQYLAIPVVVPISDKPLDLDANTIRLRGGRFVAWRIPSDPAEGGLDPKAGMESSPSGFPTNPMASPATTEGLRAIAPEDLPEVVALPPGVTASTDQPRLARMIQVDPQGRIRWNMERFIPTGSVREADNLYAMKIKPDLLTRKEPPRPRFEPVQPGETPQARADRARTQAQTQERYRLEMATFSDLRRAVMAAPQRFEARQPRLVWAIFDVNPNLMRDLHIDGPTPLPWHLPLTQLDSLRSLSKASIGSEGPSREILIHLHALVRLVMTDAHPLNLRLAAEAMAGAKLLPLARLGDDVHNVCRAILIGQDPIARARLIRELVMVTPATAATIDLLKLAARNPDPGTQMLALRGLAQSENPDPEVLNLLVETANRLITDNNAPPPLAVFEEIFAAARGRSSGMGTPFPYGSNPSPNPGAAAGAGSPSITDLLLQEIRFQFTDTTRRDQVIAAVLIKNNSEPMAAHWLNTQLLGGSDPALTLRTLELMATAKLVPSPEMAARTIAMRLPRYARTVDELYGPLPQPSTDLMRSSDPLPAPLFTPESPMRVVLRQPVILAGGDHAYFKLLRQDSPAPLQEKAWEALSSIEFPTTDTPPQPTTAVEGRPLALTATNTFITFTDIVMAQMPLSPKVVEFLARQPNLVAASGSLIRLAGHAQDQTADDILRGLLGSNRPLDQALTGMTIEDCLRFTRRMYDLHAPPLPAATVTPTAPGTPAPSTAIPAAASTTPAPAPATPATPPVAATKPALATTPAAPALPTMIAPSATTPATRAPLVVGLLRDRQKVSALAGWFMREIAAGRLPQAAAWAQAYGGESALLQQVYSSDDDLALASAAGLLASVQGPEELARTWSDQVRGQPNRSPEFAQGLWNKLKQEVFVLRLKSAAGPYRLSLRIYPAEAAVIGGTINPIPFGDPSMDPSIMYGPPEIPTGPQGPTIPPQPGKPQVEEALGILVLQADGNKVTFASQPLNVTVPDTALLLRLEKATELKNLPNPILAEIPWDRQVEPIDLWPQADNSWLARFRLVDGRVAELQLKPVLASEVPRLHR